MLWNEFSCIIKVSAISGIGVFATHDIPKDTQVFIAPSKPRTAKISDIPKEFLPYCVYLNDEECLCPERFDRMEIGWFLNHSDHPNISRNKDGTVFAIKDIQAGEEILIDYNQLNEPQHLKEPYYKSQQ